MMDGFVDGGSEGTFKIGTPPVVLGYDQAKPPGQIVKGTTVLLVPILMVVRVMSGWLMLVSKGKIVGTNVSVTVEPEPTDVMTVAPGDKLVCEVADVGADPGGGVFVFASVGPVVVKGVIPVLASRALPEPAATEIAVPDAPEDVRYMPPVPV